MKCVFLATAFLLVVLTHTGKSAIYMYLFYNNKHYNVISVFSFFRIIICYLVRYACSSPDKNGSRMQAVESMNQALVN